MAATDSLPSPPSRVDATTRTRREAPASAASVNRATRFAALTPNRRWYCGERSMSEGVDAGDDGREDQGEPDGIGSAGLGWRSGVGELTLLRYFAVSQQDQR